MIRTGMDIPTRRRASLGRTHWWWTKCSGGVYRAGCRRVCLCRYFHGAGHDQERSGGFRHRVEQLSWRVNSTVTTSSLNGATNGYNFAYWSVNGERQAAVTGVSCSKVSLDVNATTTIICPLHTKFSRTAMGTGWRTGTNSTILET